VKTSSTQRESARWLEENGPRELELLFRAIVLHPSSPVPLLDTDRFNQTLALPEPNPVAAITEPWHEGSDDGRIGAEAPTEANMARVRPLLVLDKRSKTPDSPAADGNISKRREHYALFLLDENGQFAAWYEGAKRMYGYLQEEVVGQDMSFLYSGEDALHLLQQELRKAASEGHAATEGWHLKKDGRRFRVSTVTMALKDEHGNLHGFATLVRDLSGRHNLEVKLRQDHTYRRPLPTGSRMTGVVYGESGRIPEANDAFLEITGYTREDLNQGRLLWADLTPPEYLAMDELAHEEAVRFGASKPFEKELIRKDGTRVPVLMTTAVRQLSPFRWIAFVHDLRARNRLEELDGEAEVNHNFEEIVGNGPAMRRVLAQVEVVATTDATVLILGETGTGKELAARAIHRLSPRKNLPFITLNCAAIPTGLLESELFGYERGAFTGALSQKLGRFELAHRGTLFLDEVGDIPLELQPKLLRALQEKSFERLGGTRTIPIDVRLVAATNRDLTHMMGEKLFRSDLYYRLKVFPITMPSLRDHPEDIPVLVRHFVKKYSAEMGRSIENIPLDTMRALVSWPWPGNVRELENFIERSVILTRGPILRAPLDELRAAAAELSGSLTLEALEKFHILRVFRESSGSVSLAASRLGLPRTTLNAMMKKLGISRGDL
jgi:formate hydrogenlyase transcriptional activator